MGTTKTYMVSLSLWRKMVGVCCLVWALALTTVVRQAVRQTKIRVLTIILKVLYPAICKCFLVLMLYFTIPYKVILFCIIFYGGF